MRCMVDLALELSILLCFQVDSNREVAVFFGITDQEKIIDNRIGNKFLSIANANQFYRTNIS